MSNIKDVARRAGVSPSTVSIIVNGKSEERRISGDTQVKVMEAMRFLDYHPNISARKLKEGENKSVVVALFWSFDFRRAMLARFLVGLQGKIQKSDLDIEIVIYPYISGELRKETSLVVGNKFHAAIIANANDKDLKYLNNLDSLVPIVLYNRNLMKYSSANIDDRKIGIMAAEHFVQNGYRRARIVTSSDSFKGMSIREKAFEVRMEKLGASVHKEKLVAKENSVLQGKNCGDILLEGFEKDKDIDCLFCASDALAIGITHAFMKKGIHIPEEIGILAIGNGSPYYSEFNNPPISVINVPMELMAEKCFDLLVKKKFQAETKPEHVYFETKLLHRESTKGYC
ncbi:MAG: LacI family DNA-binding transcriptional regulator [Anaerocolumna sp.]